MRDTLLTLLGVSSTIIGFIGYLWFLFISASVEAWGHLVVGLVFFPYGVVMGLWMLFAEAFT